jgi:hypothetical protein
LHALFATARDNGLRSPRLTVGSGVQLTAQRGDPNAINVREGGFYRGTIRGGVFTGRTPSESLTATLARLAADPTGELTAYGRATGRCACCSRPLTDPVSVAMSIGPICAARFGISRAGVTPAPVQAVTLAAGTATPTHATVATATRREAIMARVAQRTTRNPSDNGRVYDLDEVLGPI